MVSYNTKYQFLGFRGGVIFFIYIVLLILSKLSESSFFRKSYMVVAT